MSLLCEYLPPNKPKGGLMKVQRLTTEGKITVHEYPGKVSFRVLAELVDYEWFDFVNLRDGRVMAVDDTGILDGKPVNPIATAIYHSVCIPGCTQTIHGDVLIVNDSDFE
jgi:hypothetical protein